MDTVNFHLRVSDYADLFLQHPKMVSSYDSILNLLPSDSELKASCNVFKYFQWSHS